ncbi:hypothetical protein EUCA11A_39980 [Eubacterium callanderi]|uniref:InlB B-repeat-containing protein n=1 Tax=Eubacterium callanderi TaxID=53442 RepID=UPI0029FF4922|nr:hypothetical protein [Eubacterium callanderi]WPK69808.1 hypothetical protein EUCA2A_39980 [Eubacterium callanderi]WPK74106.1 hypothetical protein EUCA11A_39980 [Eubacterium callanderi]
MKHSKKARALSLFLATLIFVSIMPKIPITLAAEEKVHKIYNFADLMHCAGVSRTTGSDHTYLLMNDIEITKDDQAALETHPFRYISFGGDNGDGGPAFKGTFDGQGHTIKNLKYTEDLAVPQIDTGLFKTTQGATIRNLTIDNAELPADFRNGMIAGRAENTLFENIVVKNSHMRVSAANNVLSLITDGGIFGGAIVGQAYDCTLYNCESNNNFVNTNNTVGVAALGGKGLYLGGLVGTAYNTDIEYSRVIGGSIKQYYDVAVGALGGNTLYIGGLVGEMKEASKVIDCFSTAMLDFYCATYVAVGAGNAGHIGGIAGAVYSPNCEILRSHFAGETNSYQYNAILVIPIIQNDANISGICDVFPEKRASVVGTFFKPSASPGVEMRVLGSTSSTSQYGPQNDARYKDRAFWESHNYDFVGNIKRKESKYSDKYKKDYVNKWVMDYKQGIPVHGKSVAATLDFPGAGTVSIGGTGLITDPVSTTNPYQFAVQGITFNEATVNLDAAANPGYRFVNWYQVPNVTAASMPEEHRYFEKIFANNSPIANSGANYPNALCQDNDLFVARYEAQVTFHDIKGNVINDDWYGYESPLPEVTPVEKPASENARLIGWTTEKSTEGGGGYSAITTTDLEALKAAGNFYETGDPVLKAMELYPVYADLISNIITVFEGHEQDSNSLESVRDSVGSTKAVMGTDGVVTISVTGAEADGAFPDGYRFLGWYENDVCVSRELSHRLEGVDLTQAHTYTARFEYRVDYYVKGALNSDASNDPVFDESALYTSWWHSYQMQFKSLPAPVFLHETFVHWGLDRHQNTVAFKGEITAPTKVYSYSTTAISGFYVEMLTDFPGSAELTYVNSVTQFEITAKPNPGFNFIGYTWERNAAGSDAGEVQYGTESVFYKGGISVAEDYTYVARLTANVEFYNKENTLQDTVTRRYEEPVLLTEDQVHKYEYVTPGQANKPLNLSTTSVKSPDAKSYFKEGYHFIGWVNKAALTEPEKTWLYDAGEENCTTSIAKAQPYLITDTTLVYEPMQLYPIYAKYNIDTTTNIAQAGTPEGINVPTNPTYTFTDNGDGTAKIVLTADQNTYVSGNTGEKYKLISMECVNQTKGTRETLTANAQGTFDYTVTAGESYRFIANYEPLAVIYHLNDTDKKVFVRNSGDTLGESPLPTYTLDTIDGSGADKYLFVGWTTEPASSGYHSFDTYEAIDTSGIKLVSSSMIVTESMELWPVYAAIQVEVNSNIDGYLKSQRIDPETVRSLSRTAVNDASIIAEAKAVEGYDFVGWYTGYKDLNNRGTEVSMNTEYALENKEPFTQTTYTAVYRAIHEVRYHAPDGSVLYTAKVCQDEPRSFVHEQTRPGKDESGNDITITETVPIDHEAFTAIQNLLPVNEAFQQWQWVSGDQVKTWNDFYDVIITESMDLYPVIRQVTVKDSKEQEMDVVGKPATETTPAAQPQVILGAGQDGIAACLNMEYTQPKLTVTTEELAYTGPNAAVKQPLQKIPVKLYPHAYTEENPLGEETTGTAGNAVFYFNGTLTITKEALADGRKDRVFIFNIQDAQDNNKVIQSVMIPPGESLTLSLPYGQYTVSEDTEWAWRYTPAVSGDVTENKIKVSNKSAEPKVSITNTEQNNKWFDSMTRNKNEYKNKTQP